MGMSEFYGPADEAESRATLEMAVDRGISFLDTADFYGAGKNEELLADILRRRRKEIPTVGSSHHLTYDCLPETRGCNILLHYDQSSGSRN